MFFAGGNPPFGVRQGYQSTHSEQTDASGLVYMQARFYMPVWGRFMSPDPGRDQHLEETQSWNLYSYCVNSPTMKIDPTGTEWFYYQGKDEKKSSWHYQKDTKTIQVDSGRKDAGGKSIMNTLNGVKQLATFDGKILTQYTTNGQALAYKAIAGKPDSEGRTQIQLQGKRDIGPIPEGNWSFNPQQIQSIGVFDAAIGLLGRGKWAGSTPGWGTQRAWLTPEAGTETYGRTGFTIHGGATYGSKGCIDLAGNAGQFFGNVDRSQSSFPVVVNYSGSSQW